LTPERPSSIKAVLAGELAPFGLARVTLKGDDAPAVGEVRRTLALITHELATNAAKYGALSVPMGEVEISCAVTGDEAFIRWTEAGGPRVSEPRKQGYGSRFVRRLAKASGGSFSVDYRPSGLVAEIRLPIRDASSSSSYRKARLRRAAENAP
jgi:two-component sensor histidine kinase